MNPLGVIFFGFTGFALIAERIGHMGPPPPAGMTGGMTGVEPVDADSYRDLKSKSTTIL